MLNIMIVSFSGFSGVSPNFFPWLISWICDHSNDQSGRLDQAMRFASIVDGTIQRKYPTSAKHYLAQEYGAPLKAISRTTSDVITDQDVSVVLQLEYNIFWLYIYRNCHYDVLEKKWKEFVKILEQYQLTLQHVNNHYLYTHCYYMIIIIIFSLTRHNYPTIVTVMIHGLTHGPTWASNSKWL